MINIREVLRRLLKYAVMVIIVGFATYSIPNKPPSNTEIIWISLISGMVFSVIDSVTPSIKIHVEKKVVNNNNTSNNNTSNNNTSNIIQNKVSN